MVCGEAIEGQLHRLGIHIRQDQAEGVVGAGLHAREDVGEREALAGFCCRDISERTLATRFEGLWDRPIVSRVAVPIIDPVH
jgi:hypothetical protein